MYFNGIQKAFSCGKKKIMLRQCYAFIEACLIDNNIKHLNVCKEKAYAVELISFMEIAIIRVF
ncbi:MAG: hypothetical protein A2Y12_05435 [Planctomycetes bacterium GWF2_42_9]|nr:MAG: hypothetical protein A2Y12_05435 [Planctomycetes bacterium GWF2_42_9]